MNKKFLSILCVLFFLNGPSFAQEVKTAVKNVAVLEKGTATQKKISVEYPVYNQAYLLSVKFELTAQPDGKTALVISGKIENRLFRELINTEVTIELFDKNGTRLETLTAEVRPHIIDKKDKFGNFSVQDEYRSDITSCKIEITWQGK